MGGPSHIENISASPTSRLIIAPRLHVGARRSRDISRAAAITGVSSPAHRPRDEIVGRGLSSAAIRRHRIAHGRGGEISPPSGASTSPRAHGFAWRVVADFRIAGRAGAKAEASSLMGPEAPRADRESACAFRGISSRPRMSNQAWPLRASFDDCYCRAPQHFSSSACPYTSGGLPCIMRPRPAGLFARRGASISPPPRRRTPVKPTKSSRHAHARRQKWPYLRRTAQASAEIKPFGYNTFRINKIFMLDFTYANFVAAP